jgi:hypothetical protein
VAEGVLLAVGLLVGRSVRVGVAVSDGVIVEVTTAGGGTAVEVGAADVRGGIGVNVGSGGGVDVASGGGVWVAEGVNVGITGGGVRVGVALGVGVAVEVGVAVPVDVGQTGPMFVPVVPVVTILPLSRSRSRVYRIDRPQSGEGGGVSAWRPLRLLTRYV